MQRAIILANGWIDTPPGFLDGLCESDFIIAADGGAHHCIDLGLTPDVIIGDFDSLDPDNLTAFQQANVELIKFPTEKDETDLELALQLALDRGLFEVLIVAALGDRWDMSIANILLLANPILSRLKIHLLTGSQELFLIRGGDQVEIHSKVGSRLSLIPLAGDAYGISTQGLEYSLLDETLYFGSSRGVSNILSQDSAQIKLTDGLLLCIYDKADM
jgi:thiamine pyrophosphokinase